MKCLLTLSGHDHSVSSVEFSPDGNILYSASRDKTIKVWDAVSGICKHTIKGHEEWVRSLSLNTKGTLLASSADDETVIVWTTDQYTEKYSFTGHENKIEQVLFINNEEAKNNIYTGDYSPIAKSEEESNDPLSQQREKLLEIQKKMADQNKLAKKVEKEYLLTCSRDKHIKLFDVFAGTCLYTFSGHDNWVRNMIIHPTGRYLVSTGDDRSVRIWLLKTGQCVKKLDKVHDKFIVCLAASNKLNTIVTGSNDFSIKFFDCR